MRCWPAWGVGRGSGGRYRGPGRRGGGLSWGGFRRARLIIDGAAARLEGRWLLAREAGKFADLRRGEHPAEQAEFVHRAAERLAIGEMLLLVVTLAAEGPEVAGQAPARVLAEVTAARNSVEVQFDPPGRVPRYGKWCQRASAAGGPSTRAGRADSLPSPRTVVDSTPRSKWTSRSGEPPRARRWETRTSRVVPV